MQALVTLIQPLLKRVQNSAGYEQVAQAAPMAAWLEGAQYSAGPRPMTSGRGRAQRDLALAGGPGLVYCGQVFRVAQW